VTVERRHGAERSPANTAKQLEPVWIGLLDQINLPLRGQRFNDVSRWMASVMSTYSSYQTRRLACLVLGHPASKVVGDTDIDRAAFLACGHVDVACHVAISVGTIANGYSQPLHSTACVTAWILGSSRVASLLASP
jgi:hypothetical protein